MPFLATLLHIQPPGMIHVRRGMLRGAANTLSTSLDELVDRVEATTHAAAAAPQGIKSQVFREFITKNRDIQEPFLRVVQSAPEIADAAAQTYLDKMIGVLDIGGLDARAFGDKVSSSLNNYYRWEDQNGNPCSQERGGTLVSSSGAPCRMVKVAGGGLAMVRDLIKSTNLSKAARAEVDKASRAALEQVVSGPQKVWDKLSDAWKVTLALAGLAASTPTITNLKTDGSGSSRSISFEIPPGFGPFSGKFEIEGGRFVSWAASLPPVKLKSLTIEASGKYEQGTSAEHVALVVPIKKADVGFTVDHQQGPDSQQTTLKSSVSRETGAGGRVSASTSATFSPGASTVPVQYQLKVDTPIGPTKSASLSAGVTGTVTSAGQRVELAANPAVTVSVAGQLPTLNRRLREKQQFEHQQEEAVANDRKREAQIVAQLQKMNPATQKDQMWELESELIELRKKTGSANKVRESEINGDIMIGVGALAVVAGLEIRKAIQGA